ncbi:hypothetical protein HD806DRAFT_539411 [Xylariaceae sp. AK1471]|nr:hypothetical protein HD806DRAFT_539411 [Xylariaceae sp. AK1471]
MSLFNTRSLRIDEFTACRKNFLMKLSKAKFKQKCSLVTTRNMLKAYIERSKLGGSLRNAGSNEAEFFFIAVYHAVQEISEGKVISYRHIAELIGTPTFSQSVYLSACLPQAPPVRPWGATIFGSVPWQHVINSKSVISPRLQPSGARIQAAVLQAESVTASNDELGELSVGFAEYGWFANSLPSEEADEEQGWGLKSADKLWFIVAGYRTTTIGESLIYTIFKSR